MEDYKLLKQFTVGDSLRFFFTESVADRDMLHLLSLKYATLYLLMLGKIDHDTYQKINRSTRGLVYIPADFFRDGSVRYKNFSYDAFLNPNSGEVEDVTFNTLEYAKTVLSLLNDDRFLRCYGFENADQLFNYCNQFEYPTWYRKDYKEIFKVSNGALYVNDTFFYTIERGFAKSDLYFKKMSPYAKSFVKADENQIGADILGIKNIIYENDKRYVYYEINNDKHDDFNDYIKICLDTGDVMLEKDISLITGKYLNNDAIIRDNEIRFFSNPDVKICDYDKNYDYEQTETGIIAFPKNLCFEGETKPVQYDINGNIIPVDKHVINKALWSRFLVFNAQIMKVLIEGTPKSFLENEYYSACPEPFTILAILEKIDKMVEDGIIKKINAKCFTDYVIKKAKIKNIDIDDDFSEGFAEVIGERCAENNSAMPSFKVDGGKVSLRDVLGIDDL